MKLIYVFDPLCGWCFGFKPVIEQVEKTYGHLFDIEVFPGGMELPPNLRSMGQMQPYLEQAIPRLEEMTGVTIADIYKNNILANAELKLSSELPSMVYLKLRKVTNKNDLYLAGKVQNLLFSEGKNTNDQKSYEVLLDELGIIEKEKFWQSTLSEEHKKETYQTFQETRDLGVTGYPSLLISDGEQAHPIANGYIPFENLDNFFRRLLTK